MQIAMPSGSYVLVRPYAGGYRRRPGTYLNLYIHPLKVDAYHTTGLCGNYNLNPADDGPVSGSRCKADCDAHRYVHVFSQSTLLVFCF